MKYLYLLLTLCFVHLYSHAQNYHWSKALGGTGVDKGTEVDIDVMGNIIVIGSFQNTVDFDLGSGVYNLTSLGQEDIFVLKMDASGNFKWAQSIGGTLGNFPTSVKTDSAQSVFITGYFFGSMDFDPSANTDIHTSTNTNPDIFIIKLDSSGTYQWGIQYGSSSGVDKGLDLTVNHVGNVLVTGLFTGTIDFGPGASLAPTLTAIGSDDIFVVTITTNGNPVGAIKIGGPGDAIVTDIEVDSNYTVYLTGYFNGTCYFNPQASTTTNSTGVLDAFVVKLAFGGNFQWVSKLGGASGTECVATDMVLAANGNVVLTGYFKGTVDFQPGGGIANLTAYGSGVDIFVCRLGSIAGSYIWAQRTGQETGASGPDQGLAIEEDTSGNLLVAGTYSSTVDFDAGSSSQNLTTNGTTDIFVQKLTSAGAFAWVSSYGGFQEDIIGGLAITTEGQPVITGYFHDTADYDPGAGMFNLISDNVGYTDVFISKAGSCAMPHPAGAIIAPASACQWSEISVSIPPVYGATDYNWEIPNGSGIMSGFNSPDITLLLGPDSGTISLVPANSCGFSSGSSATITVDTLPIITIQPIDVNVDENSPAGFYSTCIGSSLTYQWQEKTGNVYSNLSDNGVYSGVFTNTLQISSCNLTLDGSYYRCVVTSASCTDTSLEAQLTVNDTVDVSTGTKYLSLSNKFSLHPNISDGYYTVHNNRTAENLSYSIFDMTGQLVKSGILQQGVSQLDLSREMAGVYFIRVMFPEKTSAFKLVKTGSLIK